MNTIEDVVADMQSRALRAVTSQLMSEPDDLPNWPWIAQVNASGNADLQSMLDAALVRLAAAAVQGWADASGHDVSVLLAVLATGT